MAQDMLRGPYGTDARWRKKENHFRPEGMFQIARQRAAKPPRSVLIDIIRARCRIASEMMANDTVKTSWMAELPVGMIFLEESVYDHPWSKCTYNLGHRKSFSFEPKRERVDTARRTNVDKDDVQYGQEIDVPATCVVSELNCCCEHACGHSLKILRNVAKVSFFRGARPTLSILFFANARS